MIELNATLFIQAFHFLSVWWIVDRFFFQEVVGAIQKEERELEEFNQHIEKERELIAKEQERRHALWLSYQQKFQTAIPRLNSSLITPSSQLLMCPVCLKMDASEKQEYIKQTVALITQRVLDE